MTTPAELANRFGNLSMSASNNRQPEPELHEQLQRLSLARGTTNNNSSHTLHFDFPALDLLSDENALYLPEPHLIDWRSRPDDLPFHLEMWDPLHLFHTLDSANSLEYPEIDGERAVAFVQSIEVLASTNGDTTMSIVTHTTNGPPEVRIRLSTTSDSTNATRTTFWDLTLSDWEAVMSLHRPWIEVLGDVVYRKTSRSYLAAAEKLKQHSPELHQKDHRTFSARWGSGSARPAKDLLLKHLRQQQSGRVLSFDDLEDDASIQLDCGHDISINKDTIEELTNQDCMEAECFVCGTRLLPAAEFEEATMYEEYYNVLEASSRQDGWARLHEWITDENEKTFSKSALINAVPAAAESLRLPKIIESKQAAPVSFKQTTVAVEAVQGFLAQQPETFDKSPFELVHQLGDEAFNKILGAGMAFPPAWHTFLKAVLNRAVNLASLRRCSKYGDGHGGVHLHSREVFVNVYETSAEDMRDEHGLNMKELGDALDMDVDSD